jgi:molybdopterin biosynthesis enzyme
VTFEVLVRPVLRRMQAADGSTRRASSATAGDDDHIAARAGPVPEGAPRPAGPGLPRAHLTGPQGSGILTSVSRRMALLVVPLETAEVPAGARGDGLLLSGPDDAQETHPY